MKQESFIRTPSCIVISFVEMIKWNMEAVHQVQRREIQNSFRKCKYVVRHSQRNRELNLCYT